jgi:molybdate transport system substrate-binding protein
MAEAIRSIGVTEVTYYRWRAEYGGLKGDQVKRLKELEWRPNALEGRSAGSDPPQACLKRPSTSCIVWPNIVKPRGYAMFSKLFRHLDCVPVVAALPIIFAASAFADVKVMSSGGFTAAYQELAKTCAAQIGQKINSVYGASMGSGHNAIPNRLARGEPADVIILSSAALDNLIHDGMARPGSRVDLARSLIGVVVKAGEPKPDISTVDALKRALLDAKSIAYSASVSGTYLSEELFPKLDASGQIRAKSKRISGERVGNVVARGEAQLGFQQVSELLPIAGIEFVGTLPEEVQRVTTFSAGLTLGAANPAAARQLISCLSSSDAAPTIRKTGMEPISPK